jgi:hypothetical protein
MWLLDRKGELHWVVHCQTQSTISTFIQIEVWFSNNSSVLGGIATSTLNWAHSSLNCPIQIASTSFILHFFLDEFLNIFDNLEGQMWQSNIHWKFTLTNSTQNK